MAHKPGLTRDELDQTRRALEANGGNVRATAVALGISRRAMQHRMAKLRKFTAPLLPSPIRDLDELIADRIKESRRSKNADDARDLIKISVNIDGPFGLLIFGDPHVDDAGCDFETLAKHRQLAIDHPFILAGNIGDNLNNWVGRLGQLYAHQTTTAAEGWKLVEWLIRPINWLFLIGGNHDLWMGNGDPLQWIASQAGSIYEPHGVRMALKQPCGTVTRIAARHDYPGHSIYHSLHGPKREALMGFRDHLIIAGHKHIGASEQFVTPDGLVCQIVRVSGYKIVDAYAKQLNLKKMLMHQAALIIIDPREPDTSAGRCWCAPTVERGVMFLNALRADYEQGTTNVSKRKPAAGGSKRVSTGNT
jgi:hypothetical protein